MYEYIDSLAKKIFQEVETYLDNEKEQELMICAAGFAKLCQWGRTVLLQDLPFIEREYPNLCIFSRYPFNTKELVFLFHI